MDFNLFLAWLQEGGAELVTLATSTVALFTYIIAFLKSAKRAIDKNTFNKELENAKAEVEIKLRKEYNEQLTNFMETVNSTMKSLEDKVLNKIDDNEIARQEALKKQTLELETTIEAINNKASIDDILGE